MSAKRTPGKRWALAEKRWFYGVLAFLGFVFALLLVASILDLERRDQGAMSSAQVNHVNRGGVGNKLFHEPQNSPPQD